MNTTITLTPGDSVTIVAPPNAPPPAPPAPPPVVPSAPPSPVPAAPAPQQPRFDLSLTISDLGAYLVQHRMQDGSPALVPGSGVPQLAGDAMTWRKRDYRSDGSPGGYCASDGVADTRGFWTTTWQFAPYRAFRCLKKS